jgi:uncharacterized protein with LGFP repeats
MDIGANVELEYSTRKRKIYVRGRGTKTVKSRRGQWVEEDMTMDHADTTNDFTKKKVDLDYTTWDEYFEKIVVCGCFVCRGKKQFKRAIVQRHYIYDELPMGNMPPIIVSNPIGIVVRNFPILYK